MEDTEPPQDAGSMRLIEGAQADAELKNVERVDGLDAASPTFPLADLSPVDFELLNYALFKNWGLYRIVPYPPEPTVTAIQADRSSECSRPA